MEEQLPQTVTKPDQLAAISELGQKLVNKENYIRKLEDALEQAKKERKVIAEVELPQAMGEIRMDSFRLSTGFRITLKPLLVVNYQKDKINDIDTWLDDNGFSGMVKNQISITLPKGTQEDNILELEEVIKEYGLDYNRSKSIHYQTLNAWGREMARENKDIPDELFNVYRAVTAVVE
jgi:hypothetical protein